LFDGFKKKITERIVLIERKNYNLMKQPHPREIKKGKPQDIEGEGFGKL